MPFHFCADELQALLMLLSALPIIGVFFKRAQMWVKARIKHEHH